jgi:hypothetical protein
MKCPHCGHKLSPAEIKHLWGSYCGSLQTPHAGPGRPVTCDCGKCQKCRNRERMRESREKIYAK